MIMPSAYVPKNLVHFLGLGAGPAKELARILKSVQSHKEVDLALEAANELLGGHGIESIQGSQVGRYYYDINALYVNMGDTYDFTILYDTLKEKFLVVTWGDWVESWERRGRRMY
jgi:hypothetical protein